jgi:hypothetical protein
MAANYLPTANASFTLKLCATLEFLPLLYHVLCERAAHEGSVSGLSNPRHALLLASVLDPDLHTFCTPPLSVMDGEPMCERQTVEPYFRNHLCVRSVLSVSTPKSTTFLSLDLPPPTEPAALTSFPLIAPLLRASTSKPYGSNPPRISSTPKATLQPLPVRPPLRLPGSRGTGSTRPGLTPHPGRHPHLGRRSYFRSMEEPTLLAQAPRMTSR